ncbi:hypothetical protein [Paenibacillus caui]|uniref:hypothetical protein n=1 Tax=Paenibacillus caui TaxID=2873927 RepID=UPI001CAA3631|nr:hypothetical protein [Paenibacillus caui]
MKIRLDPTLHIVDIPSSFFITTQKINLKLKVNDKERLAVYRFIEKLKNNADSLNDLSPFESKLFEVFKDKGIVNLEGETNKLGKVALPFRKLYGPADFLECLERELTPYGEFILDGPCILNLQPSSSSEQDLYVVVGRDSMYISRSKIDLHPNEYARERIEPNYYRYAAYVFLDQYEAFEHLEDEIFKVNLTIYTNDMNALSLCGIDEHHFLSSVLCETQLTGNVLHIDRELFFPLYFVEFSEGLSGNVYHSFGFDQEDAVRNLLYLMKQSGEYHNIHIEGRNGGLFELEKDSFIVKYINLYFKEKVRLYNLESKKKMEGTHFSLESDNFKYCGSSLLITLFYNHVYKGKEAVKHGS